MHFAAGLRSGCTFHKPGLAPMVWVLPLRFRQPAVIAENGVELELALLRQSLALIRFCLRFLAQSDGWGEKPIAHPVQEYQQTIRFARGRSTRGQIKFPSIA